MAESDPRLLYGIDSITLYNRTTGLPYGSMRVLGGFSGAISADLNELLGGSNKWPWGIEEGKLSSELSLTVKELLNMNLQIFMGKAPTDNAAEASGSVTTLTDKSGTVVNATTGIASVGLKSGATADVKLAKYVVKVVSATTVDVYTKSRIDSGRGTDFTIQDDLQKITASPLTIPGASATVEIPGTGLEFTGGSGTVNLETAGAIGDTAEFQSQPANTKSMSVDIGATSDTFPEFGCIAYAQKRSSGEMFEIDFVRCKGIGFPIALNEDAWAEAEIAIKAFYDSTLNKVFSIRHVTPTTP